MSKIKVGDIVRRSESSSADGEVLAVQGKKARIRWTYDDTGSVTEDGNWLSLDLLVKKEVPEEVPEEVKVLFLGDLQAEYQRGYKEGYKEAASAVSKDEPVNADGRDNPEHIDWDARRVRESAAHMLASQNRGPVKIEDADALATWILRGSEVPEPPVSEEVAKEQEAWDARPERVGLGPFGTHQSDPAPEGMSTAHAVFWQQGRKHGDSKGFSRGFKSGVDQGRKSGRIAGVRELQAVLEKKVPGIGAWVGPLADELLYGEDDTE